jgi:hypothetical protein
MNQRTLNIVAVGLISLAVIISSAILSDGYKYKFTSQENIATTGLAEKEFRSDLANWSVSFKRKAMSRTEGFTQLKKDAQRVKEYLISKGFKSNELIFSSIEADKSYLEKREENKYGNFSYTQIFDGYNLSQSIDIETSNIELVEQTSREITELINEEIEINSSTPSYFYSKLEDLKIALIADATSNATNRAKNIANKSNCDLGALRQASMGVFQITGKNSSEEFSWGGVYNTTDINKKASITVKLQFGIR